MSEKQKRHMQALVERYTRRTARSKQQSIAHRVSLTNVGYAQGALADKEMRYSIVAKGASGCRLVDIDDNEYVDSLMGFGIALFGHNPPFVMDAIRAQLDRGIQIGPEPALTGETADLICELTGMERVSFCTSGTEAVMWALRLARTYAKRDLVVMFRDSYHGGFDGVLGGIEADGTPTPRPPGITENSVRDTLVLDYNSPESLAKIRELGATVAAVLVEPVQQRNPSADPREFLRELRDITLANGSVLIFDEMISGFRMHQRGAQGLFGVTADVATYGKVAGGGAPTGIIAGKADFMAPSDGGVWAFGDSSGPTSPVTFMAGTFCRHSIGIAAAHAVLTRLKSEGPSLQERLNARGAKLASDLAGVFAEFGDLVTVRSCGSQVTFAPNEPRKYPGLPLLRYHLIDRGLFTRSPRGSGFLNYVSTAHSDDDLARIVQIVRETMELLQEDGMLEPNAAKAGPERASS